MIERRLEFGRNLRATIQLLAERGARIVAVDRKKPELKAAIKDLPASADASRSPPMSRTKTKSPNMSAPRSTIRHHRRVLQQRRHRGRDQGDPGYPLESFRKVLDVNVVGVFLGMKHVLPVMLKNNKGSIINTASIAGLMGSPHIAVYSASKHAVIGLTKSAAGECTGTGVRVNCVCPGLIDSRMLTPSSRAAPAATRRRRWDKIVERIPARRLGQASEVASIVAFLASDDASYVTGSPTPSTAAGPLLEAVIRDAASEPESEFARGRASHPE